ncbi:GyrI-like domain-containing protein [Nocardia sp. NPDC019395]|uniref:GyrI-like domain-containing protein n=1 Tax=Nocardia sp. NPDC019395 TaxID=3154686 RepID=UPI0033C24EB5
MAAESADRTAEPQVLEIAESILAAVHGRISPEGIRDFFDASFSRLATVIAAQAITITGPALARYGTITEHTMDITVGFPVNRPIRPEGEVIADRLPAGQIARLVHHGSFDGLSRSWDLLHSWITERDLTPGTARWEVYITEPNPQMDPGDLRTELNWSITPA